MSRASHAILAQALRAPSETCALSMVQWSCLVGQARNADLLGQLRAALQHSGVLSHVPEPARRHLEIAWRLSQRHREAVRWELRHIRRALRRLGVPVVILKGAAYTVCDARAAEGRIFNDVDILVPQQCLERCEEALISSGWLPQLTHPYDQRYYREWMHELPPLQHKDRATVLDVHHTLVPPTSGIAPDVEAMMRRAVPVTDETLQGFHVLAPEDMLMHSACHLFYNEFLKGLRDLYDLHCLFEQFGGQEGFWNRLVETACHHGVAEPVADAMRQSRRVFATTVSEQHLEILQHHGRNRPVWAAKQWMLKHVLQPDHPAAITGARVRRGCWPICAAIGCACRRACWRTIY